MVKMANISIKNLVYDIIKENESLTQQINVLTNGFMTGLCNPTCLPAQSVYLPIINEFLLTQSLFLPITNEFLPNQSH